MAGKEDEEWTPKSRDDWKGLFSDAFLDANAKQRSADAEEEAKRAADEKAHSDDKTGKGGDSDAGTGKKRRTFAERLLGI